MRIIIIVVIIVTIKIIVEVIKIIIKVIKIITIYHQLNSFQLYNDLKSNTDFKEILNKEFQTITKITINNK